MRVDEFDFQLPEDRIALRPAKPRDSARLLLVKPGQELVDHVFRELPGLLQQGDAFVFNDTKVIPAQLEGVRERDGAIARVGATLHLREAPDRWRAFVRGSKKLKSGDLVRFGDTSSACEGGTLDARVVAKGAEGEITFRFDVSGPVLDERLHEIGRMPLPPYIAQRRDEDERDRRDYQTLFAREEGAVAAPTAGLHFTPELTADLEAAGISINFVTLHVGAGTFLPVKAEMTEEHVMHGETGTVPEKVAARLNAVRKMGGRIVCVGTTSLRLLESSATKDGKFMPWQGTTDIFITPGYRFRAADLLITNFHLPRSTLFMLVCAFSGLETMRRAYAHAIEHKYRFYSYGDACLLYPGQ